MEALLAVLAGVFFCLFVAVLFTDYMKLQKFVKVIKMHEQNAAILKRHMDRLQKDLEAAWAKIDRMKHPPRDEHGHFTAFKND